MKKVKGNNVQRWTRGKIFIRTGEKRTPKYGELYEFNGFAYRCLSFYYEENLTDVYILKLYTPWYKKLFVK